MFTGTTGYLSSTCFSSGYVTGISKTNDSNVFAQLNVRRNTSVNINFILTIYANYSSI